uniref:Serum response factor-binding protein 1 n=1 Tax=Sinocyclocheilus grahami TaxID=75366 RepID=A0A672SHB1_SINGR
MPTALNLSNEVVKMRVEVKRVKVLLIRKLIRQISVLEKKKGSEADLEKFRRRAARLREEIHELKAVTSDSVTKVALQKDISFEKVCRNKEASLSERVIARIATHPQFSKKIQSIKAAIKAFKEQRINALNPEKQAKSNAENAQADSDDDVGSEKSNDEDGDVAEEKLNSPITEIHKSSVAELTESTDSDLVKVPPSKIITTSSEKSKRVEMKSQKAEPQKKKDLPETKRAEVEKDDEESDLSDEEEEKEYFDDSTEERFHKQSSQSEESDDDDFFLGKVTLSKSSVSSQKAKFGSRDDGARPSLFQNQRKGPEGIAAQYKDLGADRRTGPFNPNRQTFKVAGQRQAGPSGAGRGRPQFEQKRNPRGPPGRMSDPPQQSLHPSWEASRKRKEQQAQITAFQGKKIRFDDDDD